MTSPSPVVAVEQVVDRQLGEVEAAQVVTVQILDAGAFVHARRDVEDDHQVGVGAVAIADAEALVAGERRVVLDVQGQRRAVLLAASRWP